MIPIGSNTKEGSPGRSPRRHVRRGSTLVARLGWRSLAASALATILLLCSPAFALARALVRFIHAVPGVDRATVELNAGSGTVDVGSIGFAQHTQWHSIHSGTFRWTLVGSGGKRLANGSATVGDGSYDIVILLKRSTVRLGIYRARGGEPGTSLVRVIHAAPELGSPELTIDGRETVKRLRFAHATPYVSITPGTHHLAALRPGDSTPLVLGAPMHLLPGLSYTAVVLGSRGQRTRLVTLVDRGAPLVRHRGAGHPTAGRDARSVVVAPGDSLWTIARRQLGPAADDEAIDRQVVAIWDLNAIHIGTGDPNLIFAGQRLRLPAPPKLDRH